jgi:hypothetical protein
MNFKIRETENTFVNSLSCVQFSRRPLQQVLYANADGSVSPHFLGVNGFVSGSGFGLIGFGKRKSQHGNDQLPISAIEWQRSQ